MRRFSRVGDDEGWIWVPACRIAESVGDFRTEVTLNSKGSAPWMAFIVPTSLGCPPPFGWKIVSAVVRMAVRASSSGGSLKSALSVSERVDRAREDVMVVGRLRWEASYWKIGFVGCGS